MNDVNDRSSQPGNNDAALIKVRGITKRFPGVVANDNIDLEIRSGEVHAILGENGAGKTTLMKILFGMLQPDEGEIYVQGQRARFESPLDAIDDKLGWKCYSFQEIIGSDIHAEQFTEMKKWLIEHKTGIVHFVSDKWNRRAATHFNGKFLFEEELDIVALKLRWAE